MSLKMKSNGKMKKKFKNLLFSIERILGLPYRYVNEKPSKKLVSVAREKRKDDN